MPCVLFYIIIFPVQQHFHPKDSLLAALTNEAERKEILSSN